MDVVATISNILKHKLLQGVSLTTLDIRALLLDASQATDPDRNYVSSLMGEKSGAGYSRLTMTGLAVVRDNSFDIAYFTANSAAWENISVGVVDRMVLYVNVGGVDADSWIMSYHSVRVLGSAPNTTGGRLEVPPSSFGYFRLA